ncbi:cysteine hydrolase [candidate division KSB1 bacterium]|nr:cysteine hydrolase [candidate division KSB1 bacterium]
MSDIGVQENAALLVIDVQKGLYEKKTPIYQGDQLLKNINDLIDRARRASVPVIFIQHSNKSYLAEGSDAWQLHPEIQPLRAEIIIHKQHGNAFKDTNLDSALRKRGIVKLVITGLVTHGCVKATVLGGIEQGYQVVLVSDGHSNFNKDAPALIEKWNQSLNENGAELLSTKDVEFAQ